MLIMPSTAQPFLGTTSDEEAIRWVEISIVKI